MKYTLKQTTEFSQWLAQLRDKRALVAISKRLIRAGNGNLGDIKPVGSAVSEMRIFVGKGYRVYFTLRDGELILLLTGGDKGSQSRDIKRAQALLKELEA